MENKKEAMNIAADTAAVLATDEERKALAERIYELDQETYQAVGSALGRVFDDDKDHCVTRIAHYLKYYDLEHIVQAEMALIGNMARTIEDKEIRKEIMVKYDAILQEMKSMGRTFGSEDIITEDRDGLARLVKEVREKEGNHLIICISRTYGSAAAQIGLALADSLKLNFYNAEIFKTVLARLEAEQDGVEDEAFYYVPDAPDKKDAGPAVHFENEKKGFRDRLKSLYRYHGLSRRDAVFFNQSDLILNLAKKEDFVIMGRCADAILENNHIPHISIYITAPLEQRIQRVMSMNHLSYKDALKQIKKCDRRHEVYYRYYTSRRWGRASNYDLCFNSSIHGIEGSAQFIVNVLKADGIIEESDILRHEND